MEYNLSRCGRELLVIIEETEGITGIHHREDGSFLLGEKSEKPGFRIEESSNEIKIRYQKKTDFSRALFLLSGQENMENVRSEALSFQEFGVMLDFSRNAVMKKEKIKDYIRLLALMGYHFLGLYMEDTIEVEEEPYLGYARGAVTVKELKEIDAYADLFGMEVRAYIQTLAHFNQITRYEEYQEIIDTQDILLAGEERTYEFLDHLIGTVSRNLKSRKVNIGMDEAHMAGLGKYLDKHGFTDRFDIMKLHLDRVLEICRKYGLRAEMWSDMFFRLALSGGYYEEKEINWDFLKLPPDVELVYWDYYSCEENHYDRMLKQHKKITGNVGFAGGAWKWTGFAPHNAYSMEIGKAAIKVCKDNGIGSVVITAWGDNGGEAGNFSILPALYADAEYAYTGSFESSKFRRLTGIAFWDFMKLDLPNCLMKDKAFGNPKILNNASKYLLYNDIFFGTFDSVVPEGIEEVFHKSAKELKEVSSAGEFGYLFDTLSKLCLVLAQKAELSIRLKKAYDSKDRDLLEQIGKEKLPEIRRSLKDFYLALENQWRRENKSFGFEVQCIRFGGLERRLEYAEARLKEYLSGEIKTIEELEGERKPFRYFKEEDIHKLNYNLWHDMVSPSVIG